MSTGATTRVAMITASTTPWSSATSEVPRYSPVDVVYISGLFQGDCTLRLPSRISDRIKICTLEAASLNTWYNGLSRQKGSVHDYGLCILEFK